MPDENVPKSRRPTAVLIAGLVGLWPILFILIMWALAQWGGAPGEFSLAPRGTTRNVVVLVVALAATLLLDAAVIVIGLRTLKRRVGRGRLIAGVVMAAAGALAILLLVGAGIALSVVFGRGGDGKLSREERIKRCRANQEQIEIMLGPEMWGFDHPEAKAEDLKELNLSPEGDLVKPEEGPAYTTDPTIFDCPADDDEEDVDYAVDITPEGEVRVRCIDPKGIKEGHNRP
jgi:hypothetical protein